MKNITGPFHQVEPVVVPTEDGKLIEEHFGIASHGGSRVSIARMIAPPGWSEPPQTPDFEEYTLVCRGRKQVVLPEGPVTLEAGQSLRVPAGVRVQYANPFSEEVEYWSVCIPAFSPEGVHRESAEDC
jgi:ethanolamine utilization protein EutQ